MRRGSNFKNVPAVLISDRVDASKFKVLSSSTFEYVSKANKSKETCIPKNESQIKSSGVLIFQVTSKVKGSLILLK